MRNVQKRTINAPAGVIGALLDRLASADDPLWPAPAWSAIHLDAGLSPGSRGGNGRMRYSVEAYEPGRRVRFVFAPGSGLAGHHEFAVTEEGPTQCTLSNTVAGRLSGRMHVMWPLIIRWLHEAVLEDLFDNAELAGTGRLRSPAQWSPWVRVLRRVFVPRSTPTPLFTDLRG